MRVIVVVPAYNEVSIIGGVLEQLTERGYEVVVVDDASADGTAAVVQRYPVTYLRHIINRGQGAALQTGIGYALARGADIIVTFDADGQHRVDDIPALIEPIRMGNVDAVFGSRFLQSSNKVPFSRRVLLKAAVAFTRILSRANITDTHNGLRALSRLIAVNLRLTQDRMAHASELIDEIVRLKARYQEVPVTIEYSGYTLSKGQRNSASLGIAFRILISKFFR